MRPSVRDAFVAFTRDLEGPTSWMYLDVLGYVTTGYGNLINTPHAAVALPWLRANGSPATRDEVLAEWAMVRSMNGVRNQRGVLWEKAGGGHFASITRLRLDAAGVMTLVRNTFEANEKALAKRYPSWNDWPACAQMAIHSLAWARGNAYDDFPKMDAALAVDDFATASVEIEMTKESNPGNDLSKRNAANATLMRNARTVRDFHLDPDTLDWTHDLLPTLRNEDTPPHGISPSEAETLPELPAAAPSEPSSTASHPTTGPGPILHGYPDTLEAYRRRDE